MRPALLTLGRSIPSLLTSRSGMSATLLIIPPSGPRDPVHFDYHRPCLIDFSGCPPPILIIFFLVHIYIRSGIDLELALDGHEIKCTRPLPRSLTPF